MQTRKVLQGLKSWACHIQMKGLGGRKLKCKVLAQPMFLLFHNVFLLGC